MSKNIIGLLFGFENCETIFIHSAYIKGLEFSGDEGNIYKEYTSFGHGISEQQKIDNCHFVIDYDNFNAMQNEFNGNNNDLEHLEDDHFIAIVDSFLKAHRFLKLNDLTSVSLVRSDVNEPSYVDLDRKVTFDKSHILTNREEPLEFEEFKVSYLTNGLDNENLCQSTSLEDGLLSIEIKRLED